MRYIYKRQNFISRNVTIFTMLSYKYFALLYHLVTYYLDISQKISNYVILNIYQKKFITLISLNHFCIVKDLINRYVFFLDRKCGKFISLLIIIEIL